MTPEAPSDDVLLALDAARDAWARSGDAAELTTRLAAVLAALAIAHGGRR